MRPKLPRGWGALRHAIPSAFPRALCAQSETVEMRICRMQAEILEHIPSPTHVHDLGQQMHLLTCKHELWRRSLRECPFPEPWWAFLWPGGFALTKWCARHARHLSGKKVIDFASGCGSSAIQAAKAGAVIKANDIDPYAHAAIALNAARNGCNTAVGDVMYEDLFAREVTDWLDALSGQGVDIIVADPGRHFLDKSRLVQLESYPLPPDIQDGNYGFNHSCVWTLRARDGT